MRINPAAATGHKAAAKAPADKKFRDYRKLYDELKDGDFDGVLRGIQVTAQQLKTQEDEIGIQDVRLAIVADAGEPSLQVYPPDFGTVHADLARKTEKGRHIIQARATAALESR